MKPYNYPLQLAVVLACVFLAGCEWPFGTSKEEAKAGEAKMIVVNVLDDKYHNDAHISGSINVPFGKVADEAKNWNKNDKIVVYCANYSCSASGDVAKQLTEMGFANVRAYEGGTAEWASKYPQYTTGAKTEKYLSAPNPKVEAHSGVKKIEAEELLKEMEEAGLIKK